MENKKVEEITNIVLNSLSLFIDGVVCNAKDDVTWITVRGNHIPIKKGSNKLEAITEFFNKKNRQKKEAKEKSYKDILEKVQKSNDRNIDTDTVLNMIAENKKFPFSIEDVKNKIKFAEDYNRDVTQTITKFRDENGKYTANRKKLHKEIIKKLFANEKNAKPEKGEKPKFIMLGGRGGSGKSKFKKMVYSPEKCIVLDADKIKEYLPEYRGYNAYEVHEESSDILKEALSRAREKGLNTVLDATMKTEKSSKKRLEEFINKDYEIEMYYMHVPREKSAQRAISRYMQEENGRYVPMEVLLNMKNNEFAFDNLKKYADKWAMYDNDVASYDIPPILVAKS